MVLLDVTAGGILIPDAVEYCLTNCSVILFRMLTFQLLKCFCCSVASSPSLDDELSRIIIKKQFHNSVRTRSVTPFRRVNQGKLIGLYLLVRFQEFRVMRFVLVTLCAY